MTFYAMERRAGDVDRRQQQQWPIAAERRLTERRRTPLQALIWRAQRRAR